jgi:hypothetical protein
VINYPTLSSNDDQDKFMDGNNYVPTRITACMTTDFTENAQRGVP